MRRINGDSKRIGRRKRKKNGLELSRKQQKRQKRADNSFHLFNV